MEYKESHNGVDFVKRCQTEIICKCPKCGYTFIEVIEPPEPEEDD
jgi:hypothetical protein